MKERHLLPHQYKFFGWILLFVSIVLWVLTAFLDKEFSFLEVNTFAFVHGDFMEKISYFSMAKVNLTNTLTGSIFIVGGLLVAFSREKTEDEYIMNLRLSSFKWAVLINYLILLVMFLFVHGMYFLMVMIYNMFTVLILFIVHFNYSLYKSRFSYEKYH